MSKKPQPKCRWTMDDFDGSWDTECQEKFVLNDGTPHENGMRWCPYCGGRLQEARKERGV